MQWDDIESAKRKDCQPIILYSATLSKNECKIMSFQNKQKLREFVGSRQQISNNKGIFQKGNGDRQLFEYTEEIKITGNSKHVC